MKYIKKLKDEKLKILIIKLNKFILLKMMRKQ